MVNRLIRAYKFKHVFILLLMIIMDNIEFINTIIKPNNFSGMDMSRKWMRTDCQKKL